jgi:hypothetical protein
MMDSHLREAAEEWLRLPLSKALVSFSLEHEGAYVCTLCGALVHGALRDNHITFHRDVAGIDDE